MQYSPSVNRPCKHLCPSCPATPSGVESSAEEEQRWRRCGGSSSQQRLTSREFKRSNEVGREDGASVGRRPLRRKEPLSLSVCYQLPLNINAAEESAPVCVRDQL